MDARTKLRLLSGPVRPFILGKLRDAMMRPLKRRRALTMLREPFDEMQPLRRSVYPLPTADWISENSADMVAFANEMAAGRFNSFGIHTWDRDLFSVSAPDPRGLLEFARLHQLPAYAIATASNPTDDGARWFAEFKRDVLSFRTNHPPMDGPLWSVAMDCGIRLFNIVVAWDWFGQCGFIDDELDHIVATTLHDHAIVIDATLETSGGMGTSHLLGGLLGLLTVNAYSAQRTSLGLQPEDRRPSLGLKPEVSALFAQEVHRQILSDGMSFEASTGYHRQVVDILVHAEVLIRNTPHLFSEAPQSLFERIALAVRAQRELERAGMPLIGDNDDGVVVKGGRVKGWKGERVEGWKGERVSFAEFGLWIWHLDEAVLTARNGPVGQYGKGGHAHNDQNSITLRIGECPVIIDPGTYCYVSDPVRRNYDRSTSVHATVDLGVEQCWWPDDEREGLFWMIQEGQRPYVDVATDTQWRGHVRHGGNALRAHARTIDIEPRRIKVRDSIHVDGRLGTIVLPLGPDVDARVDENSAQLTFNGRAVKVSWTNATPELAPMNMAPAYYENVKTSVLKLQMTKEIVDWTISW